MATTLGRISTAALAISLSGMFCTVSLAAPTKAEQGQILLAENDPRAAMIRFELAIRQDPDDLDARLGLATALVRLGDFSKAEKMARVVVKRASSEEAQLVLSEALLMQGRYNEAANVFSNVPETAKNEALRGLILAEEALADGHLDKALSLISPAIDDNVYGPMALYTAARAQYARGDLFRAKRLVDRIVSVQGARISVQLLQARLALRSGDLSLALQTAENILLVDEQNIAARSIAVEVSLREGDVDAARRILNEHRADSAEDPRTAYIEALVLMAEGRVREAGDIATSIEPWLADAPGGAVLLARIKIQTEKYAQAEQILRKRLVQQSGDSQARQLLINVYELTDRDAQAEETLIAGLRENKDDPRLLRIQAQRLIQANDFGGAEQIFAQLQGADIALLSGLSAETDGVVSEFDQSHALIEAMTALQNGDAKLALSKAQIAVDAEPENPIGLNVLAGALAQVGKHQEAKAILETSIKSYPDYVAAILNRAKLEQDSTSLLKFLEMAVSSGAQSSTVKSLLVLEMFALGEAGEAINLASELFASSNKFSDQLIYPKLLIAESKNTQAEKTLVELAAHTTVLAERLEIAELLKGLDKPEVAAKIIHETDLSNTNLDNLFAAAGIMREGGKGDASAALLEPFLVETDRKPQVGRDYLISVASYDFDRAQSLLADDDRFAVFANDPLMMARLMRAAGRHTDALKVARDLPASRDVFFFEIEMVEEIQDRQSFKSRLEAYIAQNPTDLAIMTMLSGFYIDDGEAAKAEKLLVNALTLAPNAPIILNNLALARKAENPGAALQVARRAYQLAPTIAPIVETYAQLLILNGEEGKAREISRRALLLHPSDSALKSLF